jgi:hypothetical protein
MRGGGGVEKALVQVLDEDGCVIGWAIQVTGGGLTCAECTDDDLSVAGDLAVAEDINATGNITGEVITSSSLYTGATFYQHTGTGGFLQTTLTGIDTTAQIFIPDVVGDVTQYVRLDALISNGTARAFLGFGLQHGGAVTQNLVAGSETFQFRLNADGSVDVRRTAGALNGTAIFRAMWI